MEAKRQKSLENRDLRRIPGAESDTKSGKSKTQKNSENRAAKTAENQQGERGESWDFMGKKSLKRDKIKGKWEILGENSGMEFLDPWKSYPWNKSCKKCQKIPPKKSIWL